MMTASALVVGAALTGCASQEPAPEPTLPTTNVFGRPVSSPDGTDPSAENGAWSIVLGAFSPDRDNVSPGQTFEAAAHTALFRAQALSGLKDVSLVKRGTGYVLLYGSFESGTSGDAQRELEYVRSLEIDGARPYENAFLAPPGASAGSMPDYDLATVKVRRATRKPLYTLQIAVYGRPDNSEPTKEDLQQFRAAAEEAVTRLRSEGEQAYYYHGPNRSMVTVGIYDEGDAGFTSRFRGEGAALALARHKYPHNLLNGEAVRERLPGRTGQGASDFRLQPSRLVEVPD
ncbi:MAG: hypothetical protein GIKADHBN_02541 [Phycisphaerales bacterium]|nr:hypothetical protein [Phycisphaerales bacterium]